jgi:tRNA dimethylallyltransferase
MRQKKPLALCVTGPTATGKTEVAVAVCEALDGEIIAMDSMQVYQKLSIGTALPSFKERKNVPHHMLSIIPPDGFFAVYDYQQKARETMHQILQTGKLPVFCGGTGLYLQSVIHPLSFTKAGAEDAIRSELERELALPNGREALFDRLLAIDPETAKRLHPNNTRRVIRALEVYYSTSKQMSAQINDWEHEAEEEYMVFALHWP